jgi:hypothetical protein
LPDIIVFFPISKKVKLSEGGGAGGGGPVSSLSPQDMLRKMTIMMMTKKEIVLIIFGVIFHFYTKNLFKSRRILSSIP